MEEVVVGKVVDSLFGLAKKEISHVWNCSNNIKKLIKEAEKLSSMKGRVQQHIDLAQSKGECLLEGVVEWMNTSDAKISEAQEFAKEAEANKTCCNLKFCVNLGALYRYGKMAAGKTSSLVDHHEDGKGFETRVSLPAITPGFIEDIYQPKDLENIHTQKTALKAIVETLKDHQIVGIVGLGGVGKTTLANEAAKELKSQFDLIKSITISQTINKEKIKEGVDVAAKRIINGDTVLIILDDVWEELKLDELGIPCGSKYANCKILLTSRREDVCKIMDAYSINLNPLEEKEAWTLFERAVGEREWDERLKKVALDIVHECKGLPLFIQAVGKALKIKEDRSWEAALHRLQDATDDDDEYKRKGIAQLKLSYDYLEGKVARSCFLLCSLFPEDGIIDIERLTYYGLALGIFNKPDCNIQEAIDKVQGAVESLKSSFLLLSDEAGKYKMHDLVRDMAIIITSKGDNLFCVQSGRGLKEWKPKDHLKSCKKISLMRNDIRMLTDHKLCFPFLDTFLIQASYVHDVSDEFFRGMEKLKVLDMSYNYIYSLPQSLEQLSLLTMLDLSYNNSLRGISVLGKLTCLEILKLENSGISNIPEEMGQLANLRLLDLSYNNSLCGISVLGKLTCLEILKLENSGISNIPEEMGQLANLRLLDLSHNNFLHEISVLGKLTCLEILKLKETGISNIPEEMGQLANLRLLDLSYNNSLRGISVLGKLTCLEILKLKETGISNIPEEMGQLANLRLLDLSNNDSLRGVSVLGKLTCLEILKLKKSGISNIPEEIGHLTKLRLLDVYKCFNLSYVTPGVISKLIRLEELYIWLTKEANCEFLVELRELKLLILLHLKVSDISYVPKDFHFKKLTKFQITDHGINIIAFTNNFNRGLTISNNNFSITMPMMKLIPLTEMLVLVGIEDLDNILPGLYREEFDELKDISLQGCKNVKRLVKTCELGPMETKGKFFSKLEEIELKDLNKLEVLWDMPHPYISFCNLANIYIFNCDSLLELFPLSVAQGLVKLRLISISNCRRLVAVISQGDEQTSGSEIEKTTGDKSQTGLVKYDLDIVFPFLKFIQLVDLDKLVSFYSGHSTIAYPSLKLIEVKGCKSMERWSNGENHIPNIKFEHQGEQYSDFNNYVAAKVKTDGWFLSERGM